MPYLPPDYQVVFTIPCRIANEKLRYPLRDPAGIMTWEPLKQKPHRLPGRWGWVWVPGGVLLSHGKFHTIIGAELFHGPVRDGKGWVQLAMAAKRKLERDQLTNLEEVGQRIVQEIPAIMESSRTVN